MQEELRPIPNEIHSDPAYHCGRLMAFMARFQDQALGDVGTGVIQRYFEAASSTKSLVLGRLTQTSQFHLNKPDPELARCYNSKIAEILSPTGDNFLWTLRLESQSVFVWVTINKLLISDPEKLYICLKYKELTMSEVVKTRFSSCFCLIVKTPATSTNA